VGFEPTIRFPVYTLSKRAPSATRPSLRRETRHIMPALPLTTRRAPGRKAGEFGSAAGTDSRTETDASAKELSFKNAVILPFGTGNAEAVMGRGILLWLLGIPLPIILLIWVFGGLHG
jgi:hypothetical protein